MDNPNDHSYATSPLDPNAVRVLGVLIEKSLTTPDTYPLSMNALVTGCNQTTGRDPVMKLDTPRVGEALDTLEARGLVRRVDGARVDRFEHCIRLRHSTPPAEQAVLALLMLRGPQTTGELRARAERMHRFDDTAAVDAVIERLSEKLPPLVTTLARAPGTKESRHAHLLGGQPAAPAPARTVTASGSTGGPLAARVEALEAEVADLRALVDRLQARLDGSDDGRDVN